MFLVTHVGRSCPPVRGGPAADRAYSPSRGPYKEREASHWRHGPHLIVDVVFVGVVLVKNQLQKLPHCVHIHRLQLAGLAACLLVVAEGNIAEREHSRLVLVRKVPCSHSAQGLRRVRSRRRPPGGSLDAEL